MIDVDGKIFSAKEAKMQFKFEGKTYEAVKPISLALAWEDEPCTDIYDIAVRIFGAKYGFSEEIPLGENFKLLSDVMKEWLVEKGYLVEVAEEEKQKPNQWYKEGKEIYYSNQTCQLIRIVTEYPELMGKVYQKDEWGLCGFTPIPPPTIIETPDKAERFPTSCVHHKNSGCLNDRAIKHFGAKDSVSCFNRVPDDCPAYNNGK